jgi:hypothetical protein
VHTCRASECAKWHWLQRISCMHTALQRSQSGTGYNTVRTCTQRCSPRLRRMRADAAVAEQL